MAGKKRKEYEKLIYKQTFKQIKRKIDRTVCEWNKIGKLYTKTHILNLIDLGGNNNWKTALSSTDAGDRKILYIEKQFAHLKELLLDQILKNKYQGSQYVLQTQFDNNINKQADLPSITLNIDSNKSDILKDIEKQKKEESKKNAIH